MSVTVNIEEPSAIRDLEVPEIHQMSNEAVPEETKREFLLLLIATYVGIKNTSFTKTKF